MNVYNRNMSRIVPSVLPIGTATIPYDNRILSQWLAGRDHWYSIDAANRISISSNLPFLLVVDFQRVNTCNNTKGRVVADRREQIPSKRPKIKMTNP
jgi:hypothetical protein